MTAIDERALEAAARAMCAPFDPDERIYLGAYMKRWESHKDGARLAITAYLQALSPGSTGETDGWRDIASAPKDGTQIDIWAGERFADCRWLSDEYYTAGWWFGDHVRLIDGAATHWRPRPSPPSPMLAAAGGTE